MTEAPRKADNHKISKQQAETGYLELPERPRSLRQLQRVLQKQYKASIALGTLSNWSREMGWVATAEKYDRDIARSIRERGRERAVQEGVDRVQVINETIRRLAEASLEVLEEGKPNKIIASHVEIMDTMRAIVQLSQQALLEEGGPTERLENVQTTRTEEVDEIAEGYRKAMEDLAKKRQQTPGNGSTQH